MKALVVAGGLAQIELINQLKERGITTVLIDGNPNALARPYADKFYQESTLDIEAITNIAKTTPTFAFTKVENVLLKILFIKPLNASSDAISKGITIISTGRAQARPKSALPKVFLLLPRLAKSDFKEAPILPIVDIAE